MESHDIRNIAEAYQSMYVSENQENLTEGAAEAVEAGFNKLDRFMKTHPVGKAVGRVLKPAGPGKRTPSKRDQERRIGLNVAKEEVIHEDPVQNYRDKKRREENDAGMRGPELTHSSSPAVNRKPRSREFAHNEEVKSNLFTLMLEYLVSEGYADTNQNALAILKNMSEEWRQSIVEQLNPDLPGNEHITMADLWRNEMETRRKKGLDPLTGKPLSQKPSGGGSGASSQAKGI